MTGEPIGLFRYPPGPGYAGKRHDASMMDRASDNMHPVARPIGFVRAQPRTLDE
jgi:hypothetical protein